MDYWAANYIQGVFTEHHAWKFKGNDTFRDAQHLRIRKSIFKQVTETKKGVFTTLLTTYPAIKNKYYMEEVDSELTMEQLFEF